MTAKKLKNLFIEDLNMYSKKEAERLFFILLEDLAGVTRLQYLSNPQLEVTVIGVELLLDSLEKLKRGVPYQHITGFVDFAGLRLKVSKSALIPRPETEELAYLIKEKVHQKSNLKILDVGTGTGCLALSCAANFGDSNVEAWDVSENALALARENARINKLFIDFKEVDFLDEENLPDKEWDLIVSNPPYIGSSEMPEMDKVVVNHDPHLALFVEDDDPLIFYRAIAEYAQKNLNEEGQVFVEINQKLGEETLAVFIEMGFKAGLYKDLSGNDRFIIASK